MIAVIRIHGQVKLRKELAETLNRMRIRRKLACCLVDEKDRVMMGMLKKVRQYVAYGEIDDKMLKELILKRGKMENGKPVQEKDVDKIIEGIKKGDWKIKKYFRLHPPIGGFKKSTKQVVPKGILGKHKDITKLLGRML